MLGIPGTAGSWGGVGEFGDLPAPVTMPLLMLEGLTGFTSPLGGVGPPKGHLYGTAPPKGPQKAKPDSVLLSANPVLTQTRVTLLLPGPGAILPETCQAWCHWCHQRARLGKATKGGEAPGGHLGDLGRATEAGKDPSRPSGPSTSR